jgi:hypothetical protein
LQAISVFFFLFFFRGKQNSPYRTGLPDGAYIFKPKIPIWVNFVVSCNERCWEILWPSGLFYCRFVYFMTVWYNLWSFWYIFLVLVYFSGFGIFFWFWYIFLVLVCCTKKNLATLV